MFQYPYLCAVTYFIFFNRLAALEGHYDTVKVLLHHNADINAKDADGRSILYILALENRLAMARFLLEQARPDIESKDSEVNLLLIFFMCSIHIVNHVS